MSKEGDFERMKYCSKCGDSIPDEDELCAYCDLGAFDLDDEEELLEE